MARETVETGQASSERVGAHLMMCTRTALLREAAAFATASAGGPFFPLLRGALLQDAGAISESPLRSLSGSRLPLACNGTAQRDGRGVLGGASPPRAETLAAP
jgi:hypothetical protein